jgi:hypothetical protein
MWRVERELRGMGKAFRSDAAAGVLAAGIAELVQRADTRAPERVKCPVDGCNVQYTVYNYIFSDVERNLETLLYGLRIHHPEHPHMFTLNEPHAE